MNRLNVKKHCGVLLAQVFSLVLVICLAMPTYAAHAVETGLEGIWLLQGTPIDLDLTNGSDAGSMYCNTYKGSYNTVKADGNCDSVYPIKFTPQASTKVGCKENPEETKYLNSLETTESYKICGLALTLMGKSGDLNFVRP